MRRHHLTIIHMPPRPTAPKLPDDIARLVPKLQRLAAVCPNSLLAIKVFADEKIAAADSLQAAFAARRAELGIDDYEGA